MCDEGSLGADLMKVGICRIDPNEGGTAEVLKHAFVPNQGLKAFFYGKVYQVHHEKGVLQ